MPKILLIATKNKGKVIEIEDALKDIPVKTKSLEQFKGISDVVEDGEDFYENAVKKARHYMKATGYWTMADDSGLEVDALGNRPGVYSARYAGEEGNSLKNIEKLLNELKNVPREKRTARFKCVIALCGPEGEIFTFDGACEGRILNAPQGESGFGYDPVFYYEPFEKTFAQIRLEDKNRISHRGMALEKLREFLDGFRIADLKFKNQ